MEKGPPPCTTSPGMRRWPYVSPSNGFRNASMWTLILFIAGIVTLCTGKFQLGKNRTVVGAPARIVGLLLMMPLTLGFLIGFLIGFRAGIRGEEPPDVATFAPIELGLLAFFLI